MTAVLAERPKIEAGIRSAEKAQRLLASMTSQAVQWLDELRFTTLTGSHDPSEQTFHAR